MISIACTNCKTVLTIDDAFAGGVCRCQHCGTIQTVPSHLKSKSRSAVPMPPAAGSKSLYQRANVDAGTGLDELAGIVASSGLGSGRLRAATATATATKRASVAGKKRSKILIIIGAGALLLVLLGAAAAFWLMHNSAAEPAPDGGIAVTPPASSGDNSGNPAPPSDAVASKPTGPSFCGVPLIETSVVYVLDRGSATEQYFDALKAALFRSLELVGPNYKFAVVLTDNGSSAFSFPKSGLADASADEIQKVRSAMDDVIASGASKLRPALVQAAARHPGVICVVTAKWSIDSDDVDALKQYAQRGIRVHTFMLGSSTATDPLQQAASLSGGVFRQVSDSDLRNFGS